MKPFGESQIPQKVILRNRKKYFVYINTAYKSPYPSSLPHKYRLPVDPGLQDPRCPDLRGGREQQILVDDDEIRPFSRLEAAQPVFGERGIGRTTGIGLPGLLASQPLLRHPSAKGLAGRIFPSDRCGEPGKRA